MIEKKYRLSEREVKKVLSKGKPFFSYSLVFKKIPSKLSYARFAIVISGKSVPNAVVRNSFRRSFYIFMKENADTLRGDIVCIISSKIKLGSDTECYKKIHSEWKYILEKKLGKNI
ncbi:ribonuclease P protein component [Candidatus Gracilibacteria bacterium]|nr:ribonuclease P protein component [Candidatus Gracilibacteria bacterium]